MGWQCPGCYLLCGGVAGREFRCTREDKLCDRIDTGLLGLFPGQPFSWYQARNRDLALGHSEAVFEVEMAEEFPRTGQELVAFARELHGLIFECWPHGPGRLRTQPASFGFGTYERQGVAPEQIEGELVALGDEYGPRFAGIGDADALSRACASFLYRFFEVHPFPDGNGRVGRLLLSLAAKANQFELDSYERQSSRQRRKYVEALRYADRVSEEREVPPRNPYAALTRWMAAALQPRVNVEAEFEELDQILEQMKSLGLDLDDDDY